jgi:hypothetical protein
VFLADGDHSVSGVVVVPVVLFVVALLIYI